MRFLRHLTFSNAIALLALFFALGGAAYAGSKINGNNIATKSIGGGKLKNHTINARQIKNGTITGTQIHEGSIDGSALDLSTLGTVPSAQTAQTATSAGKADSAGTATHANEADNAKHAAEADTAKHANEADNARHAAEADNSQNAGHAGLADRATLAAEAEAVGGKTASALTVSCPAGTELYGGMCWDETTRPARLWLVAVHECGEAGGRLPTISELIAFVLRPGIQVTGQTWSGDVTGINGESEEVVLTTDESARGTATSTTLGYRCVFYRSN